MTRQLNESKKIPEKVSVRCSQEHTGLDGSALTPSGAEMSDTEEKFPLYL